MKRYTAIVLLLSFVSLLWAQADTTVQNDSTGGGVAYADHQGTDGSDQLKPLRRLSYRRSEFSLYMSRPPSQIESEEDTVTAVIEEERDETGGCSYVKEPACIGAAIVVLLVGMLLLFNEVYSGLRINEGN